MFGNCPYSAHERGWAETMLLMASFRGHRMPPATEHELSIQL